MPNTIEIVAAFGDNRADYILLGIVALILLGVGLYYAARFMKGKLKVELSRDSASSEELLSGKVALEAKKPIQGSLKVSLVGREKRIKRSSSKSGNSKQWVEVYRYTHVLEETRDFEAGFKQAYSFDLLAPTPAEVRSRSRAIAKGIDDAAGDSKGVMGGVLKGAAVAASAMAAGNIHWRVEARLDAKDVDLVSKQKCHVNLRG